MAINRTPFNALVDDNGTGLTGSIWNKAAIASVILDPADAAYPSPYLTGTWTMVDGSGAGLTIGNPVGSYIKVGQIVFVVCQPVWPVTASAASAVISGLPFPAGGWNPAGGLYQVYGPLAKMGYIAVGTGNITLFVPATGANIKNSDLSGSNFVMAGQYTTAS